MSGTVNYLRSRYYNPESRRFVNRDVVTGTIADGLTMNRYAYVNGNPVSYVDPFGLRAEHSDAMRTGFSMALDAIPFVGTVKGIQEVLTGVDWITGQQLSVADRVAEGAGVLLSVLPEGKLWGTLAAKEAIDGGAWVWKQVGKEAVEETVDAAKKQGYRLKLDLQLFAEKNRLNIGAGDNPRLGYRNGDINPRADGIEVMDANNLVGIETGSQTEVIVQNPHGYNALEGDIPRVIKPGGLLKIVGGEKNPYFSKIYKMNEDELSTYGFELVNKGTASEDLMFGTQKTTSGDAFSEKALSKQLEVILRRLE